MAQSVAQAACPSPHVWCKQAACCANMAQSPKDLVGFKLHVLNFWPNPGQANPTGLGPGRGSALGNFIF